jgi:hypothetical protein
MECEDMDMNLSALYSFHVQDGKSYRQLLVVFSPSRIAEIMEELTQQRNQVLKWTTHKHNTGLRGEPSFSLRSNDGMFTYQIEEYNVNESVPNFTIFWVERDE